VPLILTGFLPEKVEELEIEPVQFSVLDRAGPNPDRTGPVFFWTGTGPILALFMHAIQYRSDTDSDLPWTVRKYTPISKRKCKTLHKWCGARNSAVSG